MKWSEKARLEAEPVYQRIINQPFIMQLMDGTLDREKFLFYIRQDALYLAEYGKVLSGIAAKLDDCEHRAAFLHFAADTIAVENALHETFLDAADRTVRPEPSPACLLYTSYLHKQLANSALPVAAAAVLPCFRIYKEVGDHILRHQTDRANPYQNWIDTYGGEEYARAVEQAVAICDELAERASPAQQQAMTDVFIICTKLEWLFWDSAWRLEQWPV